MREYTREKITCNCCGREIIIDSFDELYESRTNKFINIKIPNKGFGSLFDIDGFNFDTCDECLVKWFKTFKYNPLI